MPGSVFLQGDTLELHAVDEADLPFLQDLVNDPSVWTVLSRATPATMLEDQKFYEEAITANDQEHVLIVAEGETVGIIGLSDINPI